MTEHELLCLVAAHPHGLTVLQAVTETHIPVGTMGSKLSRAFQYGKLCRRRDSDQKGSPLVYFKRAMGTVP